MTRLKTLLISAAFSALLIPASSAIADEGIGTVPEGTPPPTYVQYCIVLDTGSHTVTYQRRRYRFTERNGRVTFQRGTPQIARGLAIGSIEAHKGDDTYAGGPYKVKTCMDMLTNNPDDNG